METTSEQVERTALLLEKLIWAVVLIAVLVGLWFIGGWMFNSGAAT